MDEINTSIGVHQQSALGKLREIVDYSFNELKKIWEEAFGETSMARDRYNAVPDHIKNLFDAMIKEETETLQCMRNDHKRLVTEYDELKEELQQNIKVPSGTISHKPLVQVIEILETDIKKYRIIKEKRLEHFKLLCAEEDELLRALDMSESYMLNVTLPSEEQLYKFQKHIESLKKEKHRRYQILQSYKNELSNLIKELDMDSIPQSAATALYEEDSFVLSEKNLDSLGDLIESYKLKISENKAWIEELRSELFTMWNLLGVGTEKREDFLMKHKGYAKPVVSALLKEIEDCKIARKQNIKPLIMRLRSELDEMWAVCCLTDEMKDDFQLYYSEVFDEFTLEMHENELKKWKQYYNEHRDILDLAKKRLELMEILTKIESESKDPVRLWKNRGGRLLQEEKLKKQHQRDLVKIEKELISLLRKYETEHREHFVYYGIPLIDALQQKTPMKGGLTQSQPNSTFATPVTQTKCKRRYGTPSTTVAKRLRMTPTTEKRFK